MLPGRARSWGASWKEARKGGLLSDENESACCRELFRRYDWWEQQAEDFEYATANQPLLKPSRAHNDGEPRSS